MTEGTEVQLARHERRLVLERLTDELRPSLHRYAARLIGSVIDGEDVVQDTLVRAFSAIDELPSDTPLRPWLFRIAHNRAIDLMRRARRWPSEPIELAVDFMKEDTTDPENATLRREAVGLAVSHFVVLPVPQRAAVILKDVLDEPLAEIASLLELSVDAVKAHLARGRGNSGLCQPRSRLRPGHHRQRRCTSHCSSTIRTGLRCGPCWQKRSA